MKKRILIGIVIVIAGLCAWQGFVATDEIDMLERRLAQSEQQLREARQASKLIDRIGRESEMAAARYQEIAVMLPEGDLQQDAFIASLKEVCTRHNTRCNSLESQVGNREFYDEARVVIELTGEADGIDRSLKEISKLGRLIDWAGWCRETESGADQQGLMVEMRIYSISSEVTGSDAAGTKTRQASPPVGESMAWLPPWSGQVEDLRRKVAGLRKEIDALSPAMGKLQTLKKLKKRLQVAEELLAQLQRISRPLEQMTTTLKECTG